jgi:N-acetyl-1-D-myo-inositol-2-amino-2-deoxy-alpha-D-glucopyranoside deacetylase
MPSRSIVFVHAHPDDESINNGATMARYVADGVHVTLVTCTRGDEGEVIPADLAHLASDREDDLGEHRIGELTAAMSAIGVTDHRWLGGEGRFRDSGMLGTSPNTAPGAFWSADLGEAADYLVAVLREIRPRVLVTYDDHGGYGHPDHIQSHRVATYAAALAAVTSYRPDLGPAWDVPKIYWNAFTASDVDEQTRRLVAAEAAGELPDGVELPDFESYIAHRTCPDDAITARIDGTAFLEQKKAAMAAHVTQITVHGDLYTLSNNLGALVLPVESYRLAKGRSGAPDGLEDDLFAGLD